MNCVLVATMLLSAAASSVDSEVDLSKSAEYILIEHAMNDIADRIGNIKLKDAEFSRDAYDWIDHNTEKAEDSKAEEFRKEHGMLTLEEYLSDQEAEAASGMKLMEESGLKIKSTEKRSCKVFEDTRFLGNTMDKVFVTGNTWQSCLVSCEENLLCAQVIFDKTKKECKGFKMANKQTAAGYDPQNFMSGHCKTGAVTAELAPHERDMKAAILKAKGPAVAETSMLETEDMSDDVDVKIDAAEMAQIKKFEEQLKQYDEQWAKAEKANPPKVEAAKPKDEKPKAEKVEPEKIDAEKMKADIKAQMEEIKEKAKKRFEEMKDKLSPKKQSSLLEKENPTDLGKQFSEVARDVPTREDWKEAAQQRKEIRNGFRDAIKSSRERDRRHKSWEQQKKEMREKKEAAKANAEKGNEKKSSLLQTRKCTTFETQHLKKQGSLLQMGKKLVTSETTGDFLTCLHKCQQDATCKQVVYDKHASQCYKHDEVVVKAIESKFTTKYIAATCQ